jgi:hypothetical protein
MIRTALAALAVSALACLSAPTASADPGVCQFPVVILAIAGPVTLICGDGNDTTTNHTTTVTIDPSLQFSPQL